MFSRKTTDCGLNWVWVALKLKDTHYLYLLLLGLREELGPGGVQGSSKSRSKSFTGPRANLCLPVGHGPGTKSHPGREGGGPARPGEQALWFGVLMSASSQPQPQKALDSISGC